MENMYIGNQLTDPALEDEVDTLQRLEYLYEINREYGVKLKELLEVNNQNRLIFKKIQANLAVEQNTGCKCIVGDSDDLAHCFSRPNPMLTGQQLQIRNVQRV
jgi:hypothetical protein